MKGFFDVCIKIYFVLIMMKLDINLKQNWFYCNLNWKSALSLWYFLEVITIIFFDTSYPSQNVLKQERDVISSLLTRNSLRKKIFNHSINVYISPVTYLYAKSLIYVVASIDMKCEFSFIAVNSKYWSFLML